MVSDMSEERWRTGRKVGRTIYAMVGDEPSDDDQLIGLMDSAELATEAVDAHNAVVCPYCRDSGGPDTPLARAGWDAWSPDHRRYHIIDTTASETRGELPQP